MNLSWMAAGDSGGWQRRVPIHSSSAVQPGERRRCEKDCELFKAGVVFQRSHRELAGAPLAAYKRKLIVEIDAVMHAPAAGWMSR